MSTELRSSGADSRPPDERDHPVAENAEKAGKFGSFDPDWPYELSPNVSLRLESFGALAYHFGTRSLSFLKTPTLVTIVQSLSEYGSAREALSAHEVPEHQREGYLRALASLARSDMIVRA